MSDANSTAPLLGEDAPAKPSLLGTEALSARQALLDDRIRTLSLVICASAVLAAAVFYLQNILVRFVLALALRYLLTPLIGVIQYCRVPRGLAILLAFGTAVGGLVALGVLVTRSVVAFSTHAAVYHERIDQLLGTAVNATLTIQQAVGSGPIDFSDKQALLTLTLTLTLALALALALALRMDFCRGLVRTSTSCQALLNIASNVNVTEIILHTLRSFAHLTENSIYILLILAFLLAGEKGERGDSNAGGGGVHTEAERQIFAYIRGKVGTLHPHPNPHPNPHRLLPCQGGHLAARRGRPRRPPAPCLIQP